MLFRRRGHAVFYNVPITAEPKVLTVTIDMHPTMTPIHPLVSTELAYSAEQEGGVGGAKRKSGVGDAQHHALRVCLDKKHTTARTHFIGLLVPGLFNLVFTLQEE